MQKTKADVGAPAKIDQKLAEIDDTVPTDEGQYDRPFTCLQALHSKDLHGSKKTRGLELFECPHCGKRKLYVQPKSHDGHGVWYCQFCKEGGNRWKLTAWLLGHEDYKGHETECITWLREATSAFDRIAPGLIRYKIRKGPDDKTRIKISRTAKWLIADELPVVCQPTIIKMFGILEALIIQEVHYLCHFYKKLWMYHSLDEWCNRFPDWSRDTIRKKLRKMISKGKIEHRKEKGRDEYCLSYDTLDLLFQKHQNSGGKNVRLGGKNVRRSPQYR